MKTLGSYPDSDFPERLSLQAVYDRLTGAGLIDVMTEEGERSEILRIGPNTFKGPYIQDTSNQVYVVDGLGKIAVGGKVQRYKPGDVFNIESNTLYGFNTEKETLIRSTYVQPSVPNPPSNQLERMVVSFDDVDFRLVDETEPPFWIYQLKSLDKHPELKALDFAALRSRGTSPKSWDVFQMIPGEYRPHIHYETDSEMIPLKGEGEILLEEWPMDENGVRQVITAQEWVLGRSYLAPWFKGHGFRVRTPTIFITGLPKQILNTDTNKLDFEPAEKRKERIFAKIRAVMREELGPDYTSPYD
ncbi:hypothetical protein HYT24_02845 [Candidatus Pacearchaeota archaeon]|nr:hypothetical protein [Candidatus Pacearchaeota archaeon]